jgi:hypothetical protein
MITNLKACSPNMHRLFLALKGRPGDYIFTREEFDLASGEKVLSAEKAKEYFDKLESQENIRLAFDKQVAGAAVCHLITCLWPITDAALGAMGPREI